MRKNIFLILLFFALKIDAQIISGTIFDQNGNIIEGVNISVVDEKIGTYSNTKGEYSLSIKPNRSLVIVYSFIGYETDKIRIPMLKMNQNYKLDVNMKLISNFIDNVIVTDKKSRRESLSRIKTKHVNVIPGNSVGVEAILKTLPGVSSANELSSQYSVRGGNYDENLVYVNGIEIYRPFLIRSGQQEGLSFVNTDLVSSIVFSAGGFDAKYGDKMSSVLDIKYKRPIEKKGSINLGFLGGSFHYEGTNKNGRFSYLFGARHKTNQYLLNSLDTRADYIPSFTDIQALFSYQASTNWEISLLTNISNNKYSMIPNDRETEFGTVNEALKLKIFFDGQEINEFKTYFGALNSKHQINSKLILNFGTSLFQTYEKENFDILGEYFLYQLDNNLGSEEFGDIAFDLGVGKYINHARNHLEARVANISHKGIYIKDKSTFNWGLKIQQEKINDKISEWNLIDSAFFNFPHPNDNIGGVSDPNQQIILNEVIKNETNILTYRNSGFFQFSHDLDNLTFKSGTRASYWSLNEELIISPRISFAYAPIWEKDFVFRASSGIYYQSPFYKEIRDEDGSINLNIKSQKSTHFVLASDYLFYSWGRPFKWITELYYKKLQNLIPYKIDNVRIQYLTNELSNGYAKGIDFKINGEFVSGVESWASLSIMKTEEDIEGDYILNNLGEEVEVGFIPRPTDQRVNFSMFFQDYIPGNPNYKMHLNFIYGTGLSFGPPNSEKYQDILRIPDYRRVDIGFSAVLKSDNKKSKIKFLNYFKNIWISAEVFNLLDINNTVSYLWVSDISGRQYAVPNYLTMRQLNLKLNINF